MTKSSLKFISDELESIGINYEFGMWNSEELPDPYFIGEYSEIEGLELEENGRQDTTFMLTGTSRNRLLLEEAKDKISKNITKTAILPNGNGIAVFYSNAFTVPTDDAELKRIQINLLIKEWRVN